MIYRVAEEFDSFQGEGVHAGVPARFIRLAGCSVAHCPLRATCDTDYTHKYDSTEAELAERAATSPGRFVVLTGGEPLDQDVRPLVVALHARGLRVHVETSGAHDAEPIGFDWITLSPKARASELTAQWANEVKVVFVGQPVQVLREYEPIARNLSLQPLWRADGMVNVAATLAALRELPPPWRLSLQTHKFAGVR